MTRVNIGIEPSELCDQHLTAEAYKEIPRLFKYDGRVIKNAPPNFKLGKGHMLFCAQFLSTIYDRYNALIEEIYFRGFKSNYGFRENTSDDVMPQCEIDRARPLLIDRINERIEISMVRMPKWTNRKRPDWVHIPDRLENGMFGPVLENHVTNTYKDKCGLTILIDSAVNGFKIWWADGAVQSKLNDATQEQNLKDAIEYVESKVGELSGVHENRVEQ